VGTAHLFARRRRPSRGVYPPGRLGGACPLRLYVDGRDRFTSIVGTDHPAHWGRFPPDTPVLRLRCWSGSLAAGNPGGPRMRVGRDAGT